MDTSHTVIVLHGLARTRQSMRHISQKLQTEGFIVRNVGYPSRKYSIETLCERFLTPVVKEACLASSQPVHFVTHSMGGIIVRYYMNTHGVAGIGRIVMLAPPNHGSEVADLLSQNRVSRWFWGPSLQQLGTSTNSLTAQLPPIPVPCGIIAGTYPGLGLFHRTLPTPNDGVVSAQSTRNGPQSIHKTVPYTHTFIMAKKDVITAACRFLLTGTF